MSWLLLLLLWRDGPTLGPTGTAVGLPAHVLEDPLIREQLRSGLTATFRLLLRRDGREAGEARIDIRYEPWDEVYLVDLIQTTGASVARQFPDDAALAEWWASPFLALEGDASDGSWTLILEVIPFSHAERDEARRWLTAQPRAEAREAEQTRAAENPVMTTILATSIRREPIRRYRWKLNPR